MQDCSNSIADTLELLQSCTKPSIWWYWPQCVPFQLAAVYKACDSSSVRRAMFSATFAYPVEEWCRLNLDNLIQIYIGARYGSLIVDQLIYRVPLGDVTLTFDVWLSKLPSAWYQQARSTWTNVDQVLWYHMSSSGSIELIHLYLNQNCFVRCLIFVKWPTSVICRGKVK